MKSSTIIFSFLLIEEVRNSFCNFLPTGDSGIDTSEKQSYPDPRTAEIDELQPRGLETKQQNAKETADKVREKSTKDRDDALKHSQLGYNEFEADLQNMLGDANRKQQEEIQIVEQEHMIADILAAAIRKHALQKWQNAKKNNENKYQQAQSTIREKKTTIMETLEATLQAANEQLVQTYTEAEENRKRIAHENHEVLLKCQTAYENARKSAEKIRTQAEIEFWNAAANYDEIPLEPWTEITLKYDAQMEAYEKAKQEANREQENVLGKLGIGKEYKETVKKAVTEFVNTFNEVDLAALAELESCEIQLKEVKKSKDGVTKLVNNGIQKVEIEFRDAVNRAKNEAQKKYGIIFKKWKRKQAMIKLHLKKAKMNS